MPSRRAFTLIELLVVIAIIAILVSILMPSLKKTRLVANATACAVNLRSISMAIHTYAADNNEFAVPALIGDFPRKWWVDPAAFFVKDYLGGNDDVLACPSSGPPFEFTNNWVHTPRDATPSPNRYYENHRYGGVYMDYATTVEYCSVEQGPSDGPWWGYYYYPSAPLSKHHGDVNPNFPGRLVGTPPDKSHLLYDNRNADPLGYESSDTYAGAQGMKGFRHLDGYTANVGYVDGHVARFSLKIFGVTPTIPR